MKKLKKLYKLIRDNINKYHEKRKEEHRQIIKQMYFDLFTHNEIQDDFETYMYGRDEED